MGQRRNVVMSERVPNPMMELMAMEVKQKRAQWSGVEWMGHPRRQQHACMGHLGATTRRDETSPTKQNKTISALSRGLTGVGSRSFWPGCTPHACRPLTHHRQIALRASKDGSSGLPLPASPVGFSQLIHKPSFPGQIMRCTDVRNQA
jgi:hypothetical protein